MKCPVLFLPSEKNRYLDEKLSFIQSISHNLPLSKTVIIPGTEHLMVFDHYHELASEIKAFLKEVEGRGLQTVSGLEVTLAKHSGNIESGGKGMKLTKLRPFVPSGADYTLAQCFFEALGFEKLYADEGLSIFRKNEQDFFLQNIHNPQFQNNFMVELLVEDLDDWWKHIQDHELEKKYPIKVKQPTVYPWGKREIHLIDPAGVCWHISEIKTNE